MASNIVVDAGTETMDSLIAGVDDGLLITQFHYTNVTDPRTCTLTGMTRNGTFRIKDGKVAGPVKNLRFTDSLATAFLRIDGLGKERILAGEEGVVCPAARIRQLRFTSSTDF
jgi:predicted Zn-dependent protease